MKMNTRLLLVTSLCSALGAFAPTAQAAPYGKAAVEGLTYATPAQVASAEAMLANWWASTGYTAHGVTMGPMGSYITKPKYTLTAAQQATLQMRMVAWAWRGMFAGEMTIHQAQQALYQGMANHMASIAGTGTGSIWWLHGKATVEGFSAAVYNATNLVRQAIEAANAAAAAGNMAVTGAVSVIKAGAAIQVPLFIQGAYSPDGVDSIHTTEFQDKFGVNIVYAHEMDPNVFLHNYDPTVGQVVYEAQYDVTAYYDDDYFAVQGSGDETDATGGGAYGGGGGGDGDYGHNAGHDPQPEGPVIYGGPADPDLNIKHDSTKADEGRWTDGCWPPNPVPPVFFDGDTLDQLLNDIGTVECSVVDDWDVPALVYTVTVTDGYQTATAQAFPLEDGLLVMPGVAEGGAVSPPAYLLWE